VAGLVDGASTPTVGFDPTSWFGRSFLLAESKLSPASFRPGTVRRTALLDRLAASSDVPVLSVAAPPGYGKSALLSQWAEQAPHAVAWLSIEREDNDPAVLLAYLATALDRLGPVDVRAFRTRTPPGASVAAIVARRVAAAMSSIGPVAVVLDHTDLLHNPQCRDAIAELAMHLPPAARLVVASRGAPPVPIASLRARGAVVEIGADDLAMDEDEARLLLAAAGVELGDTYLAELVRDTEGWPVGLYLAALALRSDGRQRTTGFAFTGDDRLMADYLRAELLSRVPRGRVSFLLRTSVLERMTGPLCDAVTGTTGSARLLEALEVANHLVIPLDRRREWYRYHKLFQDLLRAELSQREGTVVAELHSRAAAWCAANGLPDMAIEHAMAAGDVNEAVRLVGSHLIAAYADGRLETVRRWLQWIDEHAAVESYPAVFAIGAVALALIGQAAAVERWAAQVERTPAEGTAPDGSTIESWRAILRTFLCRRGVAAMRQDARIAQDGLRHGSRWRPTALGLEGIAWLLDGEPDRGDALLARAVEAGLDIGAWPLTAAALAERAIVAIGRGDWDEAESLAERAAAIVRDGHLTDYGSSALVYAVGARIAAHRGNLPRARACLADAARLRPQLTQALPFLSVQTLLELARAYLALADPAGARVVLREARDILRIRPDLGTLPRDADDLRATLDSFQGGAVGASSLTAAELRLVPLLSTHLTFREIGERLHVSRHTVKTQAISVYRKLGVSSRSEAIERVGALGLLG
jgi:LuxR family transcriptional regulator, maltose regulon positive regulatory protein